MTSKYNGSYTPDPEALSNVLDIATEDHDGDVLRWLIEELNDGLLILDENLKLVYVNKAFARISGYSRDKLIGRGLMRFLGRSSRKTLVNGFNRRRSGLQETFEQRWILADGRVFDTIVSTRPLRDAQGSFKGSIAVVTNITDRVEAENALAESEERLRTLINALPDIVCFRDGEGRWIEASDSDLKLFNLAGADYRGKTHQELSHVAPEFSGTFQECSNTDSKAWEKASPLRYEETIHLPDGKEVVHDTIKVPLFHENGERKGLVVIGRDITERKSMEHALRESESRYRSLFEDSPISLWVEDLSGVKKYYDELSAQGVRDFRAYFEKHPEAVIRCVEGVKIVDINRSTLDLLAAESKEQLLSSLSLVVPAEEFPTIQEEFIALAEGETFYRGEIDHIALDGRRKHLMVQFNVVPGYEESLKRVVVSLLDITDHKKAREEIKKSKALLEKTFAGLREAVFIVDAKTGTILDANPAASGMFGYDKENMLGRRPDFLFANEDSDEYFLEWAADEQSGANTISLPQTTMKRSDGELILAECNVSSLKDDYGNRIASVGVVRDITEETKVREQIEQAQKLEALGALAGGIAHEINQPLNALRLYSSSLEMLLENEQQVDQATIMSRLKYILAETDKIKDIITHMRSLVRQEDSESDRTADLNESIRRAFSLIGTQIKSHGIRLSMSLASGLPFVSANPIQLEQVAVNLSINAMQALDELDGENKSIDVTTGMDNGYVKLTVSDNGPGLNGSKEDIFKPFFTTKHRSCASGMGLGLSIVDTFVRSWNGRILVHEKTEGGVEFSVLLHPAEI
jgi:PAS domain S-box-containing protein